MFKSLFIEYQMIRTKFFRKVFEFFFFQTEFPLKLSGNFKSQQKFVFQTTTTTLLFSSFSFRKYLYVQLFYLRLKKRIFMPQIVFIYFIQCKKTSFYGIYYGCVFRSKVQVRTFAFVLFFKRMKYKKLMKCLIPTPNTLFRVFFSFFF